MFRVHINGVRHCSVRFRQLHALHEQLRRDHVQQLPPFPPKKLLPLTAPQVEERRELLERYLQRLSQDPRVANGVTFNGFLLAAQMETTQNSGRGSDDSGVSVDVFLMNDPKVTVRGKTILQTDEVLEVRHKTFIKKLNLTIIFKRACRQLGVPDEHVYHFALFLVQRRKREEDPAMSTAPTEHDFSVLRKLQDFESPYISQKQSGLKLVLRKASWDPQVNRPLLY